MRVRARRRGSCPGVVVLVWDNPEVYAERKASRKDRKTARVCRAVSVVSRSEGLLLDEHARERREGRFDFSAHVDQFRSGEEGNRHAEGLRLVRAGNFGVIVDAVAFEEAVDQIACASPLLTAKR